MRKLITYFSIIVILTNCTVQQQAVSTRQTIVSLKYNEEQDKTDYLIFPFGQVSIPGKWIKTSYNTISKQQFFTNQDSILLAISLGPCNKYEFNYDGSKKGYEFLKAYYDWEKDFFVKTIGLEEKLIEVDTTNHIIIFGVKGTYQSQIVDNVFLFGENNCKVSNFSILGPCNWTEEQKVEFLKKLYLQK
jgi:hypothetical protein